MGRSNGVIGQTLPHHLTLRPVFPCPHREGHGEDAIIFAVWIFVNLYQDKKGFDPFPFGLLTLIVSLEAIFLSTFVMLSQNIEAKQADLRAQMDYEVNVKAEKEVEEIKAMLTEIRNHQLNLGG